MYFGSFFTSKGALIMKYFLLVSLLIFKIAHSSTYTDPVLETYECDGSEVTVSTNLGEWTEYSCNTREWLIRINEKIPFTVRLEMKRGKMPDEFNYFRMIPTIPVDPMTRWILRRHWFRVSLGGQVEIVPKRVEFLTPFTAKHLNISFKEASAS
jgi:hypothetical protein